MAVAEPTILLLDSGVVGRLCHPSAAQRVDVEDWLAEVRTRPGHQVILPEIIDFELRRKLIHLVAVGRSSRSSLQRLDELTQSLDYLPLDTRTLRRAAELWAEARLRGLPTAPDSALDIDVILAAPALAVGGTVVTTNPRHLERFVAAKTWEELA